MSATKKIFVHSWMPDDVLNELDRRFVLDQHDSYLSILDENEIINRVKGVSGIIAQGPYITKNIFDSASETLEIVSNVAVGFDNIDVTEATKRGILVTNTPGVLNMAVADLSMALLLAIARRIPEADKFTKDGGFKGNPFPLMWGADIAGETLGIIGMGRIGQEVAKRAKPFNLNVIYHNRNRLEKTIEESLGVLWKSLDELLSLSRYVILLCPMTEETFHLIDSDALKKMNRNSFLINVARGPVVSEKDLVMALENKEISGAALDVYEFEPKHDPRLSDMKNVILTPHAGSATVASRTGMVRLAAANVIAHLSGGKAPNIINKEALTII